MNPKRKKTNLVWIDLEMTGLDPETCTILEICVVITNSNLEVVAMGPSITVHHSEKVLRSMEPWSRLHHEKSGLTEECRVSRVSLKKAEEMALKFVKTYCTVKSTPLCGNSIWQDRRFLAKYMPKLESYLHYRIIDVSSVKELVSRWYPARYKMPSTKNQSHRAAEDILESIEELKYYRSKVFTSAGRRSVNMHTGEPVPK